MFTPADSVLVALLNPELAPDVLPEEQAALGPNAVAIRRKDFYLGRHCARKALTALGAGTGPILCGDSREPLWPPGVCGSITHCPGYWAAAVAWQKNIRSIGIDAEPIRNLPEGTLKIIATESEIRRNRRAQNGVPWDLLLFSAKESVYKAWFPLMRTWLGFEDVEIEFLPDTREFLASINPGKPGSLGGLREMRGNYELGEQHVLTCAFVL